MICTDCDREITESNPVVAMCFVKHRDNSKDAMITMCKECSVHIQYYGKNHKDFMFLHPVLET